MILLLLLAALNCPNMRVVNEHPDWTARDQKILEGGQKQCEKRYPNSPCLHVLHKKEDGSHMTWCDKEEAADEQEK